MVVLYRFIGSIRGFLPLKFSIQNPECSLVFKLGPESTATVLVVLQDAALRVAYVERKARRR